MSRETEDKAVNAVRAELADVLNAATVRGRITYVTSRGRRVAAVTPVEVAERGEHGGSDMDDERELTDVIEDRVPYDGPHDRDTVIAAAEGVAYLVRYLNNATQSGTARHTLAWANTIDSVLSRLKSAVYGMDQLFDQLSAAAAAAAEDPTLYDAEATRENRQQEGARLARQLAEQLTEARRLLVVSEGFRTVGGLAAELERAHSTSARLGNAD